MTGNTVAKIQSVIQTTLHRKLYIEQHESYESGMKLYAPAEGLAVPSPNIGHKII